MATRETLEQRSRVLRDNLNSCAQRIWEAKKEAFRRIDSVRQSGEQALRGMRSDLLEANPALLRDSSRQPGFGNPAGWERYTAPSLKGRPDSRLRIGGWSSKPDPQTEVSVPAFIPFFEGGDAVVVDYPEEGREAAVALLRALVQRLFTLSPGMRFTVVGGDPAETPVVEGVEMGHCREDRLMYLPCPAPNPGYDALILPHPLSPSGMDTLSNLVGSGCMLVLCAAGEAEGLLPDACHIDLSSPTYFPADAAQGPCPECALLYEPERPCPEDLWRRILGRCGAPAAG